MSDGAPRVSVPGTSCWRIERADRLATLVDGESYYAAFAQACAAARQTIHVLGWDVDRHARVNRVVPSLPEELGPFLEALALRNRNLRIRVLAWDGSVFFGVERKLMELFGVGRVAGLARRVQFRLDGEGPVSAALHWKVVVVDDRVAFIGGIDLSAGRWDTREHRAGDERRVEAGLAHRPFHDVQVACSGPAAAALGHLARARWHFATGHAPGPGLRKRATDRVRRWMKRPPQAQSDPWPDGLEPQLRDVDVALARTDSREDGSDVREIERLYLDAIASAKRTIYVENQYFTSTSVAAAVKARLAAPGCPEIVVVQPLHCAGWLEESTMGVLRARTLKELVEADAHGRLRVLTPRIPGDEPLHLHSKILVIDDALAHVGSANVANRSMSVDAEAGLTLEACGRADVAAAIARLRDDLVAEHLGTTPERVQAAVQSTGSLSSAIDSLNGGPRSLDPLPMEEHPVLEALMPLSAADPERPGTPEDLRRAIARAQSARMRPISLLRGSVVLGLLLALPFAWVWAHGGRAHGVEHVVQLLEPLRESVFGPLLVVAAFVVAGLVAFPISLLVLATLLVYGPVFGSCVAIAALAVSAFAGYLLGRVAGKPILERVRSPAANRLRDTMRRWGFVASAALRVVPVAPFTLINVVAGTSGVRPLDFVMGTLFGVVPWVLAGAAYSDAVRDPGTASLVAAAAFALTWGAFWTWAKWKWWSGAGT